MAARPQRPDLPPAWRRALRRLRHALTERPLDLVYSPQYRLEMAGLAHDPQRGEKILAFLAAEGLVARGEVRVPPPVTFKALGRVHRMEYLESLSDPEVLTRAIGFRVSDRERDRMLDVQRRMAGGTQLAVARALASGGVAFNLGGGFHHAFPDRAARFCLLNDVAAAVATARQQGLTGPVLIVDCDLHDGDGTRAVFAADASVHTFSLHNGSSGTDPDAVESTAIELGTGVDDATCLAALAAHLPPLVERLRPALAVYLAGTDVAADDALGDWQLTADGIFRRDRWVTALLRRRPVPVPLAIVLAGGYGRAAWTYSARYAAWLTAGRRLDPPAPEEATLAAYRRIARRITAAELGGGVRGADDDWGLSEEDVLGPLNGAGERRRFLGFYTRYGAELALERTGLLDRLRAMGFREPTIEFELVNPAGETVRLYADPAGRELLIELRARRDRSSVAGCQMLRIEWLLLQNPRAGFSPGRPPLPGQRHPGLGLLADVTSLLVLICDRLGLDGLLFVPSHYHLTTQSRRFLRFLDPEHEGLFRALGRAVEGLPLPAATRAVDGGGIVDLDSGRRFTLPAMPMVLPVTDRLRERVEGEEYETRAAAAASSHHLALAEPGGGVAYDRPR